MTSNGPEASPPAESADPPVAPSGPAARPGRSWTLVLLAILLLSGAAICVYLTRFHENALYGDASVTLENCPRTETTNCEIVNTSEDSELLGVPISALGIPTYLLLLWLTALARRRPRLLGYIFGIGLLTAAYSVYLYYVSTVRIGFLCLWCFRLYCINASIPLLAALAAWRSPLALLRETVQDLRRFAPEVRLTWAVFAGLLVLAVGGDWLYRSSLTRQAQPARAPAEEAQEGVQTEAAAPRPSASSGPQAPSEVPVPSAPGPGSPSAARGTPPAAPAAKASAPEPSPKTEQATSTGRTAPETPAPSAGPAPPVLRAGDPVALVAPLAMLRAQGPALKESPFDLQARVGRGKPLALIYWAAGYPLAESTLVSFVRFLKERAPEFEAYAVAGRGADQKAEMLWERFCMLGLSADVPLLMDDGFRIYAQLGLTDVPNVALVDGAGRLVTARIKALREIVARPPETLTGEQLMRLVAEGKAAPAIQDVPPYYPATALYGRCAPEFTLPELGTGRDMSFAGRSREGRSTLLVFWSSTCKHCQKEIPQLLRHVRAHPGEFDVVSVALIKPDRPDGFSHRRVTEAYVKTNRIPWPVLDDSSGYAEDLYGVVSTPTTFLISPTGLVAGAWFHPHENLDETIARDLPRLNAARSDCRPETPESAPRVSFSVRAPDGAEVSIDSLTDRPALVHFWATWCAPCQAELPGLLHFRRSLETMGGRLVLVSVEDAQAADRIRSYGLRLDPAFESYRAPEGGLADLLNLAYSVPRTYLLARGGKVIRTFYGSQKWDDPSFADGVRTLLQLRRN